MQPAHLLAHCAALLDAAAALHDATRHAVAPLAATPDALETHQHAAHGLAWQATYVETLRQALAWAHRLPELGPAEAAILHIGFAEYGQQLAGGIPMSQSETIRPADMDVPPDAIARYAATPALAALSARPALESARLALLHELSEDRFGDLALNDDALDMMRAQFQRLAAAEIAPHAQSWHRNDELIPLPLVEKLAELGVFGLTVPEEFGGLGLGKTAMCLVSETLSAAYLGVGSLGTRSEIAAELIRLAGTTEQKSRYLPAIATGAILPTAVFTEPDTGSDLGSLRTRAVREGDTYRIHGAKTWITHAARTDLMTLLVRTGGPGYRGLSMFLAEKPRGTPDDPFPAPGMTGTEIPVLGYRGMKEYELAFDGFAVPASALLGGAEGQGFKQLMETFESARIQTAARALGVAQNALELGLAYAQARRQFGKPIAAFPRVHGKLAMMAVETMFARQLSYHAARQKDAGRRCDIEAGQAKLLAARIAFANADAALQIHGGNGYALESPISRVLCDARILSIFEGAAEIQAQVIARGLLSRAN